MNDTLGAELPVNPMTCRIADDGPCPNRHKAHGLCMTHYQRIRRQLIRDGLTDNLTVEDVTFAEGPPT